MTTGIVMNTATLRYAKDVAFLRDELERRIAWIAKGSGEEPQLEPALANLCSELDNYGSEEFGWTFFN
jgi:hypothetical protein